MSSIWKIQSLPCVCLLNLHPPTPIPIPCLTAAGVETLPAVLAEPCPSSAGFCVCLRLSETCNKALTFTTKHFFTTQLCFKTQVQPFLWNRQHSPSLQQSFSLQQKLSHASVTYNKTLLEQHSTALQQRTSPTTQLCFTAKHLLQIWLACALSPVNHKGLYQG